MAKFSVCLTILHCCQLFTWVEKSNEDNTVLDQLRMEQNGLDYDVVAAKLSSAHYTKNQYVAAN